MMRLDRHIDAALRERIGFKHNICPRGGVWERARPIKFLAAIIKRACPITPHLQDRSPEETMNLNLLKKIAASGLAVGAFVLISPVILIYGVLFGFGIVSDIVQLSGGLIPAVLIASPAAYLMLRRAPMAA